MLKEIVLPPIDMKKFSDQPIDSNLIIMSHDFNVNEIVIPFYETNVFDTYEAFYSFQGNTSIIIQEVYKQNNEIRIPIVNDVRRHKGIFTIELNASSNSTQATLLKLNVMVKRSNIDSNSEFLFNHYYKLFEDYEKEIAKLNNATQSTIKTQLKQSQDNLQKVTKTLIAINDKVMIVNDTADGFMLDVATKQADVTNKYDAFDTDITEANQTIDDILALQPQFQAVLDETTGKDVISAPEIILGRGAYPTLGERLDSEKAEVTAQLAHKVTKGQVSVRDINKNLGKLDQTYMTDEFLQQMAGTTAINATVANNSIHQEKLVRPYVEAKKGKNLLNPYNASNNKILNASGNENDLADFSVTDFLDVQAGTTYTVKNGNTYQSTIAFYNADKQFIQSFGNQAGSKLTVISPSSAVYVRTTYKTTDVGICQLVKGGNILEPYEPFRYEFDEGKIFEPISENKLDKSLLRGVKSKNLFDKQTITNGKYVGYADGRLRDLGTTSASDYIEVAESADYVISGTTYVNQLAFYDNDKLYVSGLAGGNLNVPKGFKLTAPPRAKFIRVTVSNVNLDTFQFEKGETPSEYATFGNKIERKNVEGISPKNIFVVAKEKGDYTTITEAVQSVRDSIDNPITLIIAPGVYTEKLDLRNRYISLVGINKKTCVIKWNNGSEYPINAWVHNHMSNITILATQEEVAPSTISAYAIHLDDYGEGDMEIDNCILHSEQHASIGLGLHHNQTVKIRNTDLLSGLYAHNQQENGAENQKLFVDNCYIYTLAGDSVVLDDANHRGTGGQGDARDTVFTFTRNVCWSEEKGLNSLRVDEALETGRLSGYISLGESSFGNNINALNSQ